MAKIGIYGGTFNPVHNTHIAIAQAAFEQYKLDKVIFLITGQPPHKATNIDIADSCRLDMLELAISNIPYFEIDNRELYRPGKSYSYITFTELKSEYNDDELYFIMGSDSLINFKNWVKPDVISAAARVLAVPRMGDSEDDIKEALEYNRQHFSGSFDIIDFSPTSHASSNIRQGICQGKDVSQILPEEVYSYILDHNLYAAHYYDFNDVTNLQKEMRNELKNGRYIHTLGVANIAYSLAIKWNYPALNAMVAGMLHDCAKCLTDEKRISICKKNNIPINEAEAKSPQLLHAKVGAYLCKEKYKIDDQQIIHAIEVHTTGCPNMSLLDKIIYIADYIEPGRDKQPRLSILRKVAFEDLDRCLYMILEDSVEYLLDDGACIDDMTLKTYNYYKTQRRNNS